MGCFHFDVVYDHVHDVSFHPLPKQRALWLLSFDFFVWILQLILNDSFNDGGGGDMWKRRLKNTEECLKEKEEKEEENKNTHTHKETKKERGKGKEGNQRFPGTGPSARWWKNEIEQCSMQTSVSRHETVFVSEGSALVNDLSRLLTMEHCLIDVPSPRFVG